MCVCVCVCVCVGSVCILYYIICTTRDNKYLHLCHTGESDVFEVCGYLHGLEKRSILSLGLCLGLSYSNVEDMLESRTYREDIIAAWIQRQDQVLRKSGVPTWHTLVKALKNPQVGQGGIASDISRDKNLPTYSSTETGTVKSRHGTKMRVVFVYVVRPGWLTLFGFSRVLDSTQMKSIPMHI